MNQDFLPQENLLQTVPESNAKCRSLQQPTPQQGNWGSSSICTNYNQLGQLADSLAEQCGNPNIEFLNYLDHGSQNSMAATYPPAQQLQTSQIQPFSNSSAAGDNQYAPPISKASNGMKAEKRSFQNHNSMAFNNYFQQHEGSNNTNRTFNPQQYVADPRWFHRSGISNHGSSSSSAEESFSGGSFSADTRLPVYHSQDVSCSLSGIKPSSCSCSQHVATGLDHVIPSLDHEAADLSDVAFQQPASAQSSSQFMQPSDASLTGNLLHEIQRDFGYDKNDILKYASQANNCNQTPITAPAIQPHSSLSQERSSSSNYRSAPQLSQTQQTVMFGTNYKQNNNVGGKIHPGTDRSEKSLLVKPPFTLIAITEMALKTAESQQMTLKEIYQWIKNEFPFYRQNEKKWQNSLRHCLSFNDCFVKIPRPGASSRKNCYWSLHPDAQNMFESGHYLRRPQRFRCNTNQENVTSQN